MFINIELYYTNKFPIKFCKNKNSLFLCQQHSNNNSSFHFNLINNQPIYLYFQNCYKYLVEIILLLIFMNLIERHLENTLIPHSEDNGNITRNIYRKRLTLGRALTCEKNNNKSLREEISRIQKNINSLEKERRDSLLVGIRFKLMLDNVNAARSLNELLDQQQDKKREAEQQQQMRKKQKYLIRKIDLAESKETSKLILTQKLYQIKNKNRRDSISLQQDALRLRETSRDSNRQKYQKIKGQHLRLRQKMKKIQEFKQARAHKNYFSKLMQITQRQNIKNQTLKNLQQRQKQLQSQFPLTDRSCKSHKNTKKLTQVVFTTEQVFNQNH